MSQSLSLDRYLELLQRDTEATATVLDSGNLSAPVASCPGWTLADLGYHLGDVHRFWLWIVSEGVQEIPEAGTPEVARPADDELGAWLREGAADLVPLLRATDPNQPAWSWHTTDSDVAFIQRRVPHETSVHRWDAQAAAGAVGVTVEPIASDLAADGVEEFFLLAARARYEGEARVALHATDTHDDWVARVSRGEMWFTDGVADAPVTLTGTASDLLLTLWRRLSLTAPGDVGAGVGVAGDRAAAQAFLHLVDLN